ncbi:1-acyl-sn-glycerol-3-phosphate acyltransferase [Massilia sp. W12]|uniref:1-acyl-sn-glycerol-3-phosphate acyltransferase n=1 Tax=Massilia sp. W12 TaxID=3126507 RepID=UPI0030CC835B
MSDTRQEHCVSQAQMRTLKQKLALWLLLRLGWRLLLAPFPGPRGVLIVYPHTSNWDFPVGMLAKWCCGVHINWIGKESLFRGVCGFLFGRILRSWGGEPVVRNVQTGASAQLAARMREADWFWLAMSPEGTRRYQPQWRSGFYHIALQAQAPLGLGFIDYGKREIGVTDFIMLSGDREQDLAAIRAAYAGRQGLKPECAAPIDLA